MKTNNIGISIPSNITFSPACLFDELSNSPNVLCSHKTIRHILSRNNDRLLLVIGPSSIHAPQAAFEYGLRLFCINNLRYCK